MANHTIDCEFCGLDQRNHWPCCNKAARIHENETNSKRNQERRLDYLKGVFDCRYDSDLLPFLEILYKNKEMLPGEIARKLNKKESEINKRKKCASNNHKLPNGETAWVSQGGFIYTTAKCSLCGEVDIY